MAESYRFDTLKVRAGYDSKEHNHAVAVPIYQTVAFDFGDTERADRLIAIDELGFVYSRIGNPTVNVLEQRVAALDGGTGAIALASGMAAVSYTLLNLAEGGGRILTTPRLYGGTFDGLKIFPGFGIQIDLVDDSDDPESFRKAIREDTKGIFIESITNPDATIHDIEAIAQVARDHDIPLVVDNTFATPYLFNPFDFGADIVVYSATKAIGGHGTTLGGLIVENGRYNWANGKYPQFETPMYTLKELKTKRQRSILEVFPKFPFTARIRFIYQTYLGAVLGPFDAFLILQGLETLSERIAKQVANTEKIVKYLEGHDKVSWVSYPYAQDNKYKKLAKKYFPKGAGSIFTFGFKGSEEQLNKLINAVQLFSYHANVGDARSLIVNPPKVTHSELNSQEQELAGILPETIRLSIGLEDVNDLIADLDQAFVKAFEL